MLKRENNIMRIHGEYIINRSLDVPLKPNYKDYLNELRNDFHYICGYCGKSEMVTTKGFEIDHFVPQKVNIGMKNSYSNLVYSCFTCNRKKSSKWPTNDSNLHNNSNEGFVDPASNEYDNHLSRDKDGNIKHHTNVGKYMCEIAFKFDMRPILEIWKIMELINNKKRLAQMRYLLTRDELIHYIELDEDICKLQKIFFEKCE